MSSWTVKTSNTRSSWNRSILYSGHFGLINNGDGVVDIRGIYFSPASGIAGWDAPGTPTLGVGRYRIAKCSAITGGDDLDPVKYDTDSADLPAQVSFKIKPDVVKGDYIRFLGDNPGFTSVGSTFTYGKMTGSGSVNFSRVLDLTGESQMQPIVLREGEGIAVLESDIQTIAHLQAGQFLVRNQATGACYLYYTEDMNTREGGNEACAAALFNGVGSGVVLELHVIGMYDRGLVDQSFSYFNYRLNFLDTIFDGVDLSPVAYDTDDEFPEEIKIVKNFTMRPPGRAIPNEYEIEDFAGIMIGGNTFPPWWNAIMKMGFIKGNAISPYAPIIAMSNGMSGARRPLWVASANEDGIKLRKGQGIGLSRNTPGQSTTLTVYTISTYDNANFEVEFTYTPPDEPPSTAGFRSRGILTGGRM